MNSSDDRSGRILRGDDVSAQRWDLPDMGSRQSAKEAVQVKPPTAAEIEAIQQAAEREGYDAGYQKGQADGYQQGLKDGAQHIAEAAASLQAIVEHMAAPLAQLDEQVDDELLALVQTIAEQVLQRELDARPAALRRIIREGLQAMPSSEREGKILINPEDNDWLLDDHALSVEGWQLVADRNISRGGCRIESSNSTLDATLETRMTQAIERLFDHDEQGHPLDHKDEDEADDTDEAPDLSGNVDAPPADPSGEGDDESR